MFPSLYCKQDHHSLQQSKLTMQFRMLCTLKSLLCNFLVSYSTPIGGAFQREWDLFHSILILSMQRQCIFKNNHSLKRSQSFLSNLPGNRDFYLMNTRKFGSLSVYFVKSTGDIYLLCFLILTLRLLLTDSYSFTKWIISTQSNNAHRKNRLLGKTNSTTSMFLLQTFLKTNILLQLHLQIYYTLNFQFWSLNPLCSLY